MPPKDYFSEEPFGCHCGCGLQSFDPFLRSILNQGRERFGRPIIINSGCRCEAHNREIGGARRSAHLPGPDGLCHAADIKCLSDITRAQLHQIFFELGIRRFEASDLHLHIDTASGWLPSPLLKAVILLEPTSRSSRIRREGKKAASAVIGVIGAIIGILPGIFKKKGFKLLKWNPQTKKWVRQNDKAFSARQCRKLQAQYEANGDDKRLFTIIRWDAKEPANGPDLG